MNWIVLFIVWACILSGAYIFLYYLDYRIRKKERDIIHIFTQRTDMIPALYEVVHESISRHQDIFNEVLSLRKKEFSLKEISEKLEVFIEMQQHIHHEINFIFQVCNKNPKLLKDKHFLYLRDIIINQSSGIGKELKTYNKIIEIYNTIIRYKNYTLIGYILPFSKKPAL